MADRIITLETFPNSVEAHAARIALEAAGIRATVSDQETTGSLWHMSPALGGIKLYVNENDAERATIILEQANDAVPQQGRESAWKCPQCRESVPAEFDECWSCGHAYETGAADRRSAPDDDPSDPPAAGPAVEEYAKGWTCPSCATVVPFTEKECPQCGAQSENKNPYAPTAIPGSLPAATHEMNSLAERAFIAAVLGMSCPVIANFYSAYLAFQVFEFRHRLRPRARICLYIAVAIDALVFGVLLVAMAFHGLGF